MNAIDSAIQEFAKYARGDGGFDELDVKEAINDHFVCLLKEILGDKVDLASKYEAFDGADGLHTCIEDDESEVILGEKLAHLANFVADKTTNEMWENAEKTGLLDDAGSTDELK